LEAAAVAQAAADRADAANDRRGEAVARTVAARHRAESGTGSVEEMEALARQALPLLQEAGDDDGLARIWFTLGKVAEFRCRFEDMAQAAEQAISHARRIGWPNLFGLPAALVLGPRPADEALQALDGLLADDPNPHRRLYRARLLGMLGRFDEAWATAEEVNARLRELTGEELSAPEALASIATLVGDHEAAARYWRIFCDRLQERGNRAALSTFAPTLGRSLCMLGRYDEAESLAERSRELGDEQDVATQMLWRQVQAVVYAQRGQQEEGEQLVREAVALAEQTDALDWQGDALCDLAEVLERAGHDQDAATVLEDALDRYERKKNLAMVAQVRQRMGAGKGSPPLV
jgi:tetratricopeptide (TPR) repeat protein